MHSWTDQFQSLADGLSIGATYALIGLAFTIGWATVRTVNLALLQILAAAGMFAYVGASYGVAPAFVSGLLAAGVLGVASHFIAIVPTLHKGRIYPIITSLGVGMLITAGLATLFGDALRSVPRTLPNGAVTVAGVYISWGSLILVGSVALLVTGAGLVMRMTRIGLAFRASAWAPDLASAYGVNTSLVRFGAALVAALFIGLAGVFIGLTAGSVSPTTGAAAGLKGLVAMLLGGAGNLPGAVVGGLAVGIIESVTAQYASSSLSGAVAFAVLLIIMVLRPTGLMKEY